MVLSAIVIYDQYPMLDFNLLRAFIAVAECGGFRRAAERLHLTQSTVSQQIKRLELEAGRGLFRRSTRAVALTDEGEMLLGDARRLLQLEEAARHRPRTTAEQRPARLKLEALDLLAHSGLGEMQPLGRATETAALGDGDEGTEEVEVEH